MVQIILACYGTEYEYLHTCGGAKTDLVAEQRLPKVQSRLMNDCVHSHIIFPTQDNYQSFLSPNTCLLPWSCHRNFGSEIFGPPGQHF